jgi:Ni/Co efflux regulator RcnB
MKRITSSIMAAVFVAGLAVFSPGQSLAAGTEGVRQPTQEKGQTVWDNHRRRNPHRRHKPNYRHKRRHHRPHWEPLCSPTRR